MKVLTTVARVFLGAFLFANGVNFWHPFLPIEPPANIQAQELMHGLVASGLFEVVKVVEIATGFLLLINRFVPLALALMVPLTVVIGYVDLVLIGSVNAWIFGCLLIVPLVFLMLRHLPYYTPVLALRAKHQWASMEGISRDVFGG